jgi:hypothetical protein
MQASTVVKPSPLLLLASVAIALLIGSMSRADDREGWRDTSRREFSEPSRAVVHTPPDLDVNPARGQSPQQRVSDLNECHERAVARAGYDPNHASTGFQIGQKRLDYDHALSACLENRGYTVK